MRHALFVVLLAGCTYAPPSAAPAPREPVAVDASFADTWDATIDHFAAANMPIANIDRASGFVASERMTVPIAQSTTYADCGLAMGMEVPASSVVFNVVVRGDSASSTVRVTSSYQQRERGGCTSLGVWESDLEASIKALAEGGGR